MTRPVGLLGSWDVVVAGGGSAGMTAAIAAARLGARTLLVERYGFPGGISTQVLDTFYGFYVPGTTGCRVVGGLPWEIASGLMERGDAFERPNSYGAGTGVTYDQDALKLLWDDKAKQAGVDLLYHALLIDVETSEGNLKSIEVATKGGRYRLDGTVFVDATGDADLVALAGAPFERAGERGEAQSLTTTFRLANVDVDRARQLRQPELQALMTVAIDDGYALPRREGSAHITPLPGQMATNMTRVPSIDLDDPFALAEAEIEGRRQAAEYARFLIDRVPGYERARLTGLSTQIGLRETRRIDGAYRLTRDDVLGAQQFADAIARCGAPIEAHHQGSDTRWEYLPDGAAYSIPYRALLPKQLDGVIVAGRCLSATYDAHASVRSMATCMAMGQAAGTAAALCARSGCAPRAIDVMELQTVLRANGAMLSENDGELDANDTR
jgi:glycine/D-amino acid oxidase-like deaminating enzyme